jgi:NADPH-dependent F420 reductase
MNITIIGTGNMANGIATRLRAGGHKIRFHARDMKQGEALAKNLNADVEELGAQLDDVVVLAVPFGEIVNVTEQYGEALSGKTVIDITNPIDFATFELIPPAGTAGAEEVANLMPEASVVKAFNTTFAGTLLKGEIAGQPLDVFVAADDPEAKDLVMQLVKDAGMRPINAGPLENARHLEGFQLIHMQQQDELGTGWMSGIKIVN